jgi:transketolase
MSAKVFGLNNLVAIVDKNDKQAQGSITDRFNLHPIPEKWTASGWNVIEIDGHNMEEILAALYAAEDTKDKPTVIIADTVKGKGYEPAENHPAGMHNAPFTKEQYEDALAALSR